MTALDRGVQRDQRLRLLRRADRITMAAATAIARAVASVAATLSRSASLAAMVMPQRVPRAIDVVLTIDR
jgi:hypothetical protein